MNDEDWDFLRVFGMAQGPPLCCVAPSEGTEAPRKVESMSKLSQPMKDVLITATLVNGGDQAVPVTGAARTIAALKDRGLLTEDGLFLTDVGFALRRELLGEVSAQSDTDAANDNIVEELDTIAVEAPQIDAEAQEDFQPYVVPNRKDKRASARLMARMGRRRMIVFGRLVRKFGLHKAGQITGKVATTNA